MVICESCLNLNRVDARIGVNERDVLGVGCEHAGGWVVSQRHSSLNCCGYCDISITCVEECFELHSTTQGRVGNCFCESNGEFSVSWVNLGIVIDNVVEIVSVQWGRSHDVDEVGVNARVLNFNVEGNVICASNCSSCSIGGLGLDRGSSLTYIAAQTRLLGVSRTFLCHNQSITFYK